MTRKDYELIASVFKGPVFRARQHGSELILSLLHNMAEDMASKLKADNPRFNKETFLRASGLTVHGP